MQTNYREPWQHVYGHDTHNVKRDKAGRMLGPITMGLDDYDRACACVNALAGLNPEAVADVIDALINVTDYAMECASERDERPGCIDEARAALKALKGES